jgi:hypothetical protein
LAGDEAPLLAGEEETAGEHDRAAGAGRAGEQDWAAGWVCLGGPEWVAQDSPAGRRNSATEHLLTGEEAAEPSAERRMAWSEDASLVGAELVPPSWLARARPSCAWGAAAHVTAAQAAAGAAGPAGGAAGGGELSDETLLPGKKLSCGLGDLAAHASVASRRESPSAALHRETASPGAAAEACEPPPCCGRGM